MQPAEHIRREREFIAYAEHLHTSYVLLQNGIENARGCNHQFLASIVFTAFTFEAFMNHVGGHEFVRWSEIERSGPQKKLGEICKKLEIEANFLELPWSIIDEIFTMRNQIAHGKTEALIDEQSPSIETYDQFFWEYLQPTWQSNATRENAQNAIEQVEKLMRIIWDKSSLPHHELFQLGQQKQAFYTSE